jgi:hypothetical protein
MMRGQQTLIYRACFSQFEIQYKRQTGQRGCPSLLDEGSEEEGRERASHTQDQGSEGGIYRPRQSMMMKDIFISL